MPQKGDITIQMQYGSGRYDEPTGIEMPEVPGEEGLYGVWHAKEYDYTAKKWQEKVVAAPASYSDGESEYVAVTPYETFSYVAAKKESQPKSATEAERQKRFNEVVREAAKLYEEASRSGKQWVAI